MDLRWSLLLLVPLAVLLVWLVRRLRHRAPWVALLGVVVTLLVWCLMIWVEWYRDLWLSPDEAFGSVEYIMRDVEYGWLYRYAVYTAGWLAGLAYFIACWAFAWFGPGSGRGKQPAGNAG